MWFQDFRGTVCEIAKFLNKSLSESQLKQLEQHCSFRSMQSNDSVNYSWMRGVWNEGQFLRKGENTACLRVSVVGSGPMQVEREPLILFLYSLTVVKLGKSMYFVFHVESSPVSIR